MASSDPISVSFTVRGEPVAQGSLSVLIARGKRSMRHSNPKLDGWREAVGWEAKIALRGGCPAGKNVPIRLTAAFFFKGDPIRDKTSKPDLDRLLRAIGDALTGVLWADDSQVVEIQGMKFYGDPRVEIRVEEVLPPGKQFIPSPIGPIPF